MVCPRPEDEGPGTTGSRLCPSLFPPGQGKCHVCTTDFQIPVRGSVFGISQLVIVIAIFDIASELDPIAANL